MTEEPAKPKKTVLELITGTTGQVTAVMIALTAFLTQVPELKTAGQKAFCAVVSCAAGPDTAAAASGAAAGGSPASGGSASTTPASDGGVAAGSAVGTADARLSALRAAGIDFSVEPAQMREWLDNALTPYPAVADALVALLQGRTLRQNVYLDVIVGIYENGNPSPRTVADVNRDQLKAAVVAAYRERYGAPTTDFQALVR